MAILLQMLPASNSQTSAALLSLVTEDGERESGTSIRTVLQSRLVHFTAILRHGVEHKSSGGGDNVGFLQGLRVSRVSAGVHRGAAGAWRGSRPR